MQSIAAFAPSSAGALPKRARYADKAARRAASAARMCAPAVTRRRLGQLALGASVAAALAPIAAVAADAKKKPPAFLKDDSGIRYYDVKPGSGPGPAEGDFVVVDYLAFLSNGQLFDTRKGFVFQMGQRQVIPGLENAIATMKPGGERKIVVPPKLAYGDRGVCLAESKECLVPPGETLGFQVTLLRVAIPPT